MSGPKSSDWKPISSAPYGKVLEVKNDLMRNPVLASRGYLHNGMVHPDTLLFTTHYTPDQFFPTPSGQLACPTLWREVSDDELCDDEGDEE